MAAVTIGIDLGGSHVLAAAVTADGEIVDRVEHEIDDRSFENVLDVIVTATEGVLHGKKHEATAIGIGSPGNVELETGVITYSPNFLWHDAPLGPRLRERFRQPLFVANDARCATVGEHAFGTGRGTQNFVLLTLGTGIGGGIVCNGTLVVGLLGGAGEIGHHQIRATDGFYCNCGKTGCFEAQASGTGLIRHALTVAPSFPKSTLVSGKPEKLGSKAIRKAAEAGDPHGLAAWNRYCDDLAIGLANIVAFLNPETIALGGGVAGAGDFMTSAIRPRVETLTTMIPRGHTKIVTAALGNDAGAIGAATIAARGGLLGASAQRSANV